MRKWFLLILIVIGLSIGINTYGASIRFGTDEMILQIPPSLLGDLHFTWNNEEPALEISFSHDEFFYDQTINITINTSSPDAQIYFTTDGSDPTVDSELFVRPLELTAGEEMNLTVLKAIAINGSEFSPILTHSYFVGKNIAERFSTYVFSISSDNDGLYGHENGILVPGEIFTHYMAVNPDAEVLFDTPANYNQRGIEWERVAVVEVFTKGGERVISQNAGIRVHGGASRMREQKSLRLIARREYEREAGRFYYDFFREQTNDDIFGKPISSYDTLILRNDGNDFTYGRLRSPLGTRIARKAGYNVVSPSNAAAVFINGEYYGYADLNVSLNEKYLGSLFGVSPEHFEIVRGGSHKVSYTAPDELQIWFKELIKYAEEDKIEFIKESFDTDNLLLYYAIQIYIANTDWPRQNIEIWRYTGPPAENNSPIELDGRWRFIMYDLDCSMAYSRGSRANRESIQRLLEGDAPLFAALINHAKYAEQLANYLCDMAYEHFSVKNVNRVINELNQMNLQEQKESLILHGRDYEEFMEFREPVYDFFDRRSAYVMNELKELFGYTDLYRIVSDGRAKINTLNSNEGHYFIENSVPVTPIIEEGQIFDYWLVNGEKRYDENLIISVQDADSDNTVYVQLITREKTIKEREELPPLSFTDTYDTGDLFGFIMSNHTDIAQSTRGLYLSDDIGNLKRWAFPSMVVRPGVTLEFVGRNATSYYALLKIGLNFNPRQGEIIYLSNEDGDILDFIEMSS